MKILIAEDNAHIRQLIVRLLQSAFGQFELFECSDGAEAVQYNSIFHPDLILMDIMMDKMDGISATRKIHKKNPETKIVIVSQLSEEEFRAESISAGAAEFLNKGQLYDLPDKIKMIMH